jgi:hypothetical protein
MVLETGATAAHRAASLLAMITLESGDTLGMHFAPTYPFVRGPLSHDPCFPGRGFKELCQR